MSPTSDFRVTLLGTGVPTPVPDHSRPSTLVQAGDQTLLIDAGRGAAIRLYQLGVPMGRINALLLTPRHSDHTSGSRCLAHRLADVVLRPAHATVPRDRPARGAGSHVAPGAGLCGRHQDPHRGREAPAKASPSRSRNSTATASYTRRRAGDRFEVDHGDAIKPAYGYRIEYGGRAAVISGDTRYNENVVKHGAGADLLVHEVAAARPALMGEAYIQRIIAHHDAARSGPRFLAHASEACRLYAPGAARERQGSAAGSAGSDRRDARDL